MANFNRVILAGNLTREPEIRQVEVGGEMVSVCDFSIAVNDTRSKREDAVDFFSVTAWRKLAEIISEHKSKGDPILVEGRLKYSSWEAQDGSKRSKVDVVAENVQFLGRNANGGSGASSPSEPVSQEEDEDFDSIPF